MSEEFNGQTLDASVWAKEFCARFGTGRIDEGLMIGWFANAIEYARDHARPAEAKAEAGDLRDKVAQEIFYFCDSNGFRWEGENEQQQEQWRKYADRIIAMARSAPAANTEGLRDIAGEVWDIVLPYITGGKATELYDRIRVLFPVPDAVLRGEEGKS